jgi:lipid-A-disaccharide synthase
MNRPLKIALVAGEPSGDRLGGALMQALKQETDGSIEFLGVGGPAMAVAGAEQGFKSFFAIDDIAVMGFAEVFGRLPTIVRRMKETEKLLTAAAPDALITIDSPSFGLRIARKLRDMGANKPVLIHYVAPSVWAWRPKRAKKLAQHVDHLMALLPFEPPYFHREGLSCDFVGHPVVEQSLRFDWRDRSMREELGVTPDSPLIVALPGSRRSEIQQLAAPFGEALRLVREKHPGLRIVTPLAETVAASAKEMLCNWPGPVDFLDPRTMTFDQFETRKFRAFAAADAALAASGTVSLELAAARTPMVIGYRVNALSAAIAKRLIKIDTATLVNLVSETKVVPEFIQKSCEPVAIAQALDQILDPRSAVVMEQMAAQEQTMLRLRAGQTRPSRRAAQSVLAALERLKNA